MGELWVWIDQDLCTGDGLCTDHCPEVFRLLDDGISYVVDVTGEVHHHPGGAAQPASVPARCVDAVVAAASDCPSECIFLEEHAATRVAGWASSAHAFDDDEDGGAEDIADVDSFERTDGWPRRFRVRWHHGDGTTTVLE